MASRGFETNEPWGNPGATQGFQALASVQIIRSLIVVRFAFWRGVQYTIIRAQPCMIIKT